MTLQECKTLFFRGWCGRCPRCGEGKIFSSYLKQKPTCEICGLDLAQFRSDDGPAWLTILLTGHIVMPLAIYFSAHDVLPPGVLLVLLLSLTCVCVFVLLPRAKGLFIGVLWRHSLMQDGL